ncbi:MAG: histidine ammonia-lyase [Alphaproteobacteria bacterium]|nr:histidine ammonia-lyase [Alphaproteobacteria bacterium]
MRLIPAQVSLEKIRAIYCGDQVEIGRNCRKAVEKAHEIIRAAALGDAPIYGVNTGFGKLASVRIASRDTEKLQRNLILSHAAGVGTPLATNLVRLVMALKMMSLGRGASGVRWAVIVQIEAILNKGVIPVIPSQGSVGASGDLAPLAHMAATMIGEGQAQYKGETLVSGEALRRAGLAPITLGPKEGLALINGTQVSTALALAGLFDIWDLALSSLVTGAMSTEAAMGSSAPFRPEIHALRGQPGQIDAARCLRELQDGSAIRESHRAGDERVQDPYCIRCQPQVLGAALDVLRQAANVLEIEANAVTDNPLVLPDGSIVSGGNFHAEPVGFAADQIAMAASEIGAIAQRRISLLVDPSLSFGLPAFLSPNPGLNSGMMIAEVTSAALMSENKALSNPRVVDSTPTSANQEDHVSMACHGARRLGEMAGNLAGIIGIEGLTAAQGIELRAPLKTSPALAQKLKQVREVSTMLSDDRLMAPEIAAVVTLVKQGGLLPDHPPQLKETSHV